MRVSTFELTLLSDVIQTAAASSLGVHQSLGYLRGGSILGAVASAIYDKSGDLAFAMFHSGRVRFRDAQLLDDDGAIGWPIPAAWMREKQTRAVTTDDERWVGDAIYVTAHLESPAGAGRLGLEPAASGFATRSGRRLSLRRNFRLKTAIDRDFRGRVKESSLFGYESLPAGSRWLVAIEVDDDVDRRADELINEALDGQPLWLGRSRGAEYGRVEAALVDREVTIPGPGGAARRIAVVCLSDLALAGPSGEPTTTLAPEQLGLPAGFSLVPWRSQISVRRYSPFNGYRRHRTVERVVIERGSTLVFEGPSEVEREAVRAACAGGIGMYREEGLGQLAIDPWLVESLHPRFEGSVPETSMEPEPETTHPLARWMERRAEERQMERAIHADAERLARKFRTAAGKAPPTRTQWNRLAGLARSQADLPAHELRERIEREIFSMGDARGVGANQWSERLRHVVLDALGEKHAGLLLFEAAKLASKKQSKHREGEP